MPNLAQSLKREIQRISRREIKSSVTPIHAFSVELKKTVADLKKRIAVLEAENERLLSIRKKTVPEEELSSEVAGKVRITAKSIVKLREKLGLSQPEFATLINVSKNNVFIMEHKKGRLKVRKKTLANILAVRRIGKREARKRLEMGRNGE